VGERSEIAHVEELEAGSFWDIELGGTKGNILDQSLVAALTQVFREAGADVRVKALCLHGRGEHFSFGASVEEHLPDKVEDMLRGFHGLFTTLLASDVVALAAVRGRCLGGGLELASFCQRVFASPDAMLGQPEIVLGVFAPMASLLLSERVGRANAEDLCLTGRILTAEEAHRIGLVDEVTDAPEEAARVYFREHFAPKSAGSLRIAARALRYELRERLSLDLPAIEDLYLEELMATPDATEGLRAFLEKRSPRWTEPGA
jgi:cyclohexa-1,5-dienecarbonyl-CoA hydratase